MAKTAEMTPMKNKVRMSYICVMAATDTTKQVSAAMVSTSG